MLRRLYLIAILAIALIPAHALAQTAFNQLVLSVVWSGVEFGWGLKESVGGSGVAGWGLSFLP